MTLKTLGSRTFAALAFGALTLHGIATTPASGVGEISGGTGGFGPRHYARQEPEGWERVDAAVFDTWAQHEDDEEAVIIAVLAEAVTPNKAEFLTASARLVVVARWVKYPRLVIAVQSIAPPPSSADDRYGVAVPNAINALY